MSDSNQIVLFSAALTSTSLLCVSDLQNKETLSYDAFNQPYVSHDLLNRLDFLPRLCSNECPHSIANLCELYCQEYSPGREEDVEKIHKFDILF